MCWSCVLFTFGKNGLAIQVKIWQVVSVSTSPLMCLSMRTSDLGSVQSSYALEFRSCSTAQELLFSASVHTLPVSRLQIPASVVSVCAAGLHFVSAWWIQQHGASAVWASVCFQEHGTSCSEASSTCLCHYLDGRFSVSSIDRHCEQHPNGNLWCEHSLTLIFFVLMITLVA